MNLGARTAAWSGGLSAKSYVQDGLIFHLDGVDNVAYGKHDATSNVWKDLIGGVEFAGLNTYGYVWEDNCINTNQSDGALTCTLPTGINVPITVECICERVSGMVLILLGATTRNRRLMQFNSSNVLFRGGDSSFSRPYSSNNRSFVAIYDSDNISPNLSDVYIDNSQVSTVGTYGDSWDPTTLTYLFGRMASYLFRGRCYSIRFYNRALTAAEIAANYAVDKARFGLT